MALLIPESRDSAGRAQVMTMLDSFPGLKNRIAFLVWLTLAAPSLAAEKDALSIRFELGDSNGVYPFGEPLPATVSIQGRTTGNQTPRLVLTLRSDNLLDPNVIERSQRDLRGDLVDAARQSFAFRPSEPGFYRVTATVFQGSRKRTQKSMLFGCSPDKIEAPLTREPDFEAFWNDRRAELDRVKPRFKMTRDPKRSTRDMNTHLVEMRSHGNVTIRGW